MPLLRKPVLLPIVGLDYQNPSTMINDRGGYPKNMRLYRNWLKKREGNVLYGTPSMTDQIMGLFQYQLRTLSIRLLRISKTEVEVLDTQSMEWNDITGTALTGGDENFIDGCVAEDTFIFTNYIDVMRTYDDSGNTANLIASSGTLPKCKHLEYHDEGYLIAGYVNESGTVIPNKVMWTDTGDITKWGDGNYGSRILQNSPAEIRGLKNLNEYTIAYKKDAIYIGRPVDTTDVIKWDAVTTKIGLMNHRSVIDYRGIHYFAGIADFHSFNGMRPESIADRSIQRECFGRLNRGKTMRNFAFLVDEHDEVWFFMTPIGSDWPTEIWKYNYRTHFWYYDTCSELTAAVIYYQQTARTVDELVGTVDQQNWRIDDALLGTDYPFAVVGDSSGRTWKMDPAATNDGDNAIDGEWQSMDFAADKLEGYKRWLELDFEAKGNSITVHYSTDYGTTWKSITEQTLTGAWVNYKVYLDVVAPHIRFKFSNNNASETFHLRQFYPYFLHREEVNR